MATEPVDSVPHGGYFTVQDLRGSDSPHDFNFRGYNRQGLLLLHTWHIGELTMQMECASWRERGFTQRPFQYIPE